MNQFFNQSFFQNVVLSPHALAFDRFVVLTLPPPPPPPCLFSPSNFFSLTRLYFFFASDMYVNRQTLLKLARCVCVCKLLFMLLFRKNKNKHIVSLSLFLGTGKVKDRQSEVSIFVQFFLNVHIQFIPSLKRNKKYGFHLEGKSALATSQRSWQDVQSIICYNSQNFKSDIKISKQIG